MVKNHSLSKQVEDLRTIFIWRAQLKNFLFEQQSKRSGVEILEIMMHDSLSKKMGLSSITMMLGLLPFLANANNESLNFQIKDYGTRGHVFPIKERSLLEVIEEKLKVAHGNGSIKDLQEKFHNKVKLKISRPQIVSGINHTTSTKERIFDPTYTQQANITDHLGRIIIKKGTTVNPLDHISWGEPLIFIDGDELSHVVWAVQQKGKIILVKGAPLDLEEQYHRWFYFDQAGLLTRKFAITQVPARITQFGRMLKIEEIRL